jgi:hypothetical protein
VDASEKAETGGVTIWLDVVAIAFPFVTFIGAAIMAVPDSVGVYVLGFSLFVTMLLLGFSAIIKQLRKIAFNTRRMTRES